MVTVGSLHAGSAANIIDDHAVIDLNLRTYDTQTREHILRAIRRMVDAECRASGSPRDAEYEVHDHFPLTSNDAATTARVADAFAAEFGDAAVTLPRQAASEDFSDIPEALGIPYTYWGVGEADPDVYAAAESAGRIPQDVPVNHSAAFAPVIQPTLDVGTRALVAATLAWVGRDATDAVAAVAQG